MNNLAITYKATADLLPYINNAKKHSADQVAMLAASIKEFGFNNPILTDGDNGVIAGHGRLQAAQKLGLETVPTIELSHLSAAQKKAYILADNRLGEVGTEWDMELVNLELEALQGLEFDLSLTGFELELGDEEPDYQGDPDDTPALSESEPVSQRGMVWLCGEHRVMCGDSTSPEDVRKLMNGKKADMVFTDPPYRMKVEGGISQPIGRAAVKLGEEIKHLCDFDPIAFLGVLPTVFENKKMNSFVFCNKDLVPDYLAWGVKCGYSFNILFWKKPNAIPLGGQWRPDVEYLLVFRKSAIWNNALSYLSYSKYLRVVR